MIKRLVLAAVAAVGLNTAAQAEDWAGWYAGILGGASNGMIVECGSECTETLPGIAKVFGYNWVNGDLIYGIDEMLVASFWPYDDPVHKLSWQKMVRVGTEITDDILLYGAVGAGLSFLWVDGELDGYAPYGAIAAGVEMALQDSWRWRTHVQYSRSAPFECQGICTIRAFSVATGIVKGF